MVFTQLTDSSSYGISLLDRSQLHVAHCTLQGGSAGLKIENSYARCARTFFVGNEIAGCWVDSESEALRLEDNSDLSQNGVGILVISGTIRLLDSLVHHNRAGLVVANHEIVDHVGMPDHPVHIIAERSKIVGAASEPAMLFRSAGSLDLSECEIIDPGATNEIQIASGLKRFERGSRIYITKEE